MHSYLIGATGVGKSTLLLSQMFAQRTAFAFLDKHGTTARQIADALPCVYWRPADLDFPVGFNPLQNVPPDLRWKVTADITAVFADIWQLGPETPRLLYYLRAAVRLLLDTPGTTLLDIRQVLSNDHYRSGLARRCFDKQTRQTWDEFSHKDARQQATEIASLQNKVAALADPLPLRLVLGQPRSTISFSTLLCKGTPLVVDLSGLGDEPAALLGAVVINAFKQAAEASTDPADYDLYIDEFQNFGTHAIATILSEARKWRLHLTIAHQFVSQLSPEIRDAVLGNCATLISFRVGPEDAPIIGAALDCPPQPLLDLPVGAAWYRTLVNGAPTSATLMRTEVVKLPTGCLEGNVRNTRANFARPRAMAEPKKQRSFSSRGWWGG